MKPRKQQWTKLMNKSKSDQKDYDSELNYILQKEKGITTLSTELKKLKNWALCTFQHLPAIVAGRQESQFPHPGHGGCGEREEEQQTGINGIFLCFHLLFLSLSFKISILSYDNKTWENGGGRGSLAGILWSLQ